MNYNLKKKFSQQNKTIPIYQMLNNRKKNWNIVFNWLKNNIIENLKIRDT